MGDERTCRIWCIFASLGSRERLDGTVSEGKARKGVWGLPGRFEDCLLLATSARIFLIYHLADPYRGIITVRTTKDFWCGGQDVFLVLRDSDASRTLLFTGLSTSSIIIPTRMPVARSRSPFNLSRWPTFSLRRGAHRGHRGYT